MKKYPESRRSCSSSSRTLSSNIKIWSATPERITSLLQSLGFQGHQTDSIISTSQTPDRYSSSPSPSPSSSPLKINLVQDISHPPPKKYIKISSSSSSDSHTHLHPSVEDHKSSSSTPFNFEKDILSKLYIIQSLETRSKFLLKVFPDHNPFYHHATCVKNTNTSHFNDQRDSGCSVGIYDQERQVLKQVVRLAIENEVGAMKWFQSNSERSVVPEILRFSYFGGDTNDESCLESFGLLGLLFMKFPQNGTLYQGPASECRLGKSARITLNNNLAKILHDSRKEQYDRVCGFSTYSGSNNQENTIWTISGTRSRFDLIVDILDKKSFNEPPSTIQNTDDSQATVVSQRRSGRSFEKHHQRNGSSLPCIPEDKPQSFSRGESLNLSNDRTTHQNYGGVKASSSDSLATSLSNSSQNSASPEPLQPPRFPSGISEVESFHPRHHRFSSRKLRINDKNLSNLRRKDSAKSKSTSFFDQDPTVYCSAASESTRKCGGNRGKIMKIEYLPSQNTTCEAPTATTGLPSPQSLIGRISSMNTNKKQQGNWMEENYLCWPTNFVHPAISVGQNFYISAIEYEQARLYNSLVALGKLDSFPGSTCRFPRRLLNILERVLPIVHDELLFMGSKLDLLKRRRIPIKAQALLEKRDSSNNSSIFASISSVFTHGHLDPSSIIINQETGEILAMINFQHAGFLPCYSENVQPLFIESCQLSFWNMRNVSSLQGSNASESSTDKKPQKSRATRPGIGSFFSSIPFASSELSKRSNKERHMSPEPCNMRLNTIDSQHLEESKGCISPSNQGSYWTSYPVINHYPPKGSQTVCETQSYTCANPMIEYSPIPSLSRQKSLSSPQREMGKSSTDIKNKKSLSIPDMSGNTVERPTQDMATRFNTSSAVIQQNGSLTSNIPKLNQEGWVGFMEGYRELERKSNRRQSLVGKLNRLDLHHNQAIPSLCSLASSPQSASPPSSPSSPPRIRDTRYFERGHDSEVLEALIRVNKTLQNLVVTLEAGGNALTPNQLLNAISRKKSEIEDKEQHMRINEPSSSLASSIQSRTGHRGTATAIGSTLSKSHELLDLKKKPLKRKKRAFFKSILNMFLGKKYAENKPSIPPKTYRPTRTSADNILYSAPGVQRDPLPCELPDRIREEVVVSIVDSTSQGTSSSGTPAMPVYGIQLSNREKTRSLIPVETETPTEKEKDTWKEFEGLCEPLAHRQLVAEKKHPGIALLDIDDLERNLEKVECHILKLERLAAKHSQEKSYKNFL